MRHLIFWISALISVWTAACADPKCPPDYILTQGRCKRCPAGSEAHHDVCVNEGGVIASPARPDDNDDSGPLVNGASAETGPQPIGAIDSGPGAVAPAPTTPQLAEAGTGAVDSSVNIAIDSGAAPMTDPCQGMAGCVACTSTSQCPEPGACLVKQCNMAKGICEPSFAAAQTACGSSKCDGAGKCVGCLSDSDCGEPGECKVRYCNPTTRVCEPRNAPSTTSCPAGHCQDGACVQCSSANECADRTCQTKSCTSGQCRYSNVPAGQKGACTSGVCTASQQCRECVGDEQCASRESICNSGRCFNNVCVDSPKTGACGNLRKCSGGMCIASCPDNTVDAEAGEQCEATSAGMNNWSCNSMTCARTGLSAGGSGTSFRRRCTSASQCAANEVCAVVMAFWAQLGESSSICVPACDGSQCRRVPGYTLSPIADGAPCNAEMRAPCLIRCTSASDCPPSVSCNAGMCAGPFF